MHTCNSVLFSLPTCLNHTLISFYKTEGVVYSVESANYFINAQEPKQHVLIPTWKILEEQEYTIRVGGPRPFQTSVTTGSPVFLRTYC